MNRTEKKHSLHIEWYLLIKMKSKLTDRKKCVAEEKKSPTMNKKNFLTMLSHFRVFFFACAMRLFFAFSTYTNTIRPFAFFYSAIRQISEVICLKHGEYNNYFIARLLFSFI